MSSPLRDLATDPGGSFDAEHIFAYASAGPISWQQLLQRVGAWHAALAAIPASRIALYNSDALEFTAALLACWRCGKIPLIPVNNLPLTCQQIRQSGAAFAGEFSSEVCVRAETDPLDCQPLRERLQGSAMALILFTSGSTGNPTPVGKTFAQLEAEIGTLEALWGAQLASSVITSTVSHQHIYGLLFKLLWPLCRGRAIIGVARDYWEQVVADCARFPSAAIVSSPAHLGQMPPIDWDLCRGRLRMVFSSGAPLAEASARDAQRRLGLPVTEVYGSTETGGVAWRRQSSAAGWHPFPAVQLRPATDQQRLEVRGPHLSDQNWFSTSDCVRFESDGTFHLLGRMDRIAKVAGKRISLDAVERELLKNAWLIDVKVVPLPARNHRLGAVVVLTNEGNRELVDRGRPWLNTLLKNGLEDAVERVAIPRYWRYLAEIPRNSQGKIVGAELRSLFDPEQRLTLPRVLDQIVGANDELVLQLFVPTGMYYFNGHFPGRPILPGVAQLDWAVHFATAHWGELGRFQRLEAVKFHKVVGANQQLELRLSFSRETQKVSFSYRSDQQHSSGRVVFVAEIDGGDCTEQVQGGDGPRV